MNHSTLDPPPTITPGLQDARAQHPPIHFVHNRTLQRCNEHSALSLLPFSS